MTRQGRRPKVGYYGANVVFSGAQGRRSCMDWMLTTNER
jgi:hypothetical protein